MRLEQHLAKKPALLAVRIAQRLVALTLGILINTINGRRHAALAALVACDCRQITSSLQPRFSRHVLREAPFRPSAPRARVRCDHCPDHVGLQEASCLRLLTQQTRHVLLAGSVPDDEVAAAKVEIPLM